ncbi:MAG: (2Fe-2S)-binding protein [Nitrospinae bacterium RIFCSPLOWO2_12_FULL_47_7]|nr:MAG: (2Fe-2S)-binding protein [Nitrospinae bacterium RIFCSPLOWO2_12_FULL_47_7]
MLDITFVRPDGKIRRKIRAESGENLRLAAIRNKFSIYPHIFKILNCRGRALCTSCTVEIVSGNVSPRSDLENDKLKSKIQSNPRLRLACQVNVTDNLVVKTQCSF